MFVLAVEEFREALGLIEVERAGGIVQFRPSALGAELAVGDQVAERRCHAALGLRSGPWPNNRADGENQL